MLGSAAAAAPAPKVTICHFPPGNPANVQVITVGAPAVPAHVANHNDAVCPAGDSDCCFGGAGPSVCTNLATDVNNCGACGNVCNAGVACNAGVCVSPTNTPIPVNTPTPAIPSCDDGCPVCQTCDQESGTCVPAAIGTACGNCGDAGFCEPHCGTRSCEMVCINIDAGGSPCDANFECPAGSACVAFVCAGGACDPELSECFESCQ